MLKQAGIDRATVFAVMVPDDAVVLAAVGQARRLNPDVHIVARCAYVSGGFEATKRGADRVIVAELAVAKELARVVSDMLAAGDS